VCSLRFIVVHSGHGNTGKQKCQAEEVDRKCELFQKEMEWVLGKTQGEVWASEKSAVKIRFFFLRLPHFHLE